MNSIEATYGASQKRFQMPLCDRQIITELSNDYTLPDYQSEIRRVLKVCVSVLPPAKYVGSGNAEFNGTVDYTLIYVGSDGAVYSAPLSAEYSFTAPLDISSQFDLNEGVTLLADICEDSVTTRVSSPRKLNIKCRLLAHVMGYGMMVAEERCVGETNPISIERRDESAQITVMLAAMGETIEAGGEINLDSDEVRVASAFAEARISEISAADGYADCRGELNLKLLLCRDEDISSAETVTKTVSFNDRIEIDELTPNSLCRAKACVSDLSVSVEDGRIVFSAGIIPEMLAFKPTAISYTRDLYSTENHCDAAYRDYKFNTMLGVFGGNLSQSERIPLSNTSVGEDSRIVDVWCTPSSERFEIEKNKCILSGQCRYVMLIEHSGEYSTADISLPFRYSSDCECNLHTEYSADISAISSRVRIDNDTLCVDTELSISLYRFEPTTITTLSEIRFGETVEKSDGDIIICFPAPDDTPWSVAKKYSVPASKISEMANYIVINK